MNKKSLALVLVFFSTNIALADGGEVTTTAIKQGVLAVTYEFAKKNKRGAFLLAALGAIAALGVKAFLSSEITEDPEDDDDDIIDVDQVAIATT